MLPNITQRINNKRLFCPYCQSQLTLKEEYLYCEFGDCDFSQRLIELIEEGLASARMVEVNNMLPEFVYGCPSCNSRLHFSDGRAFCESCGFDSLGVLYINLLRGHTHR